MEISREFVWILIGTAAVTLVPRVLPLMLLSKMKLPDYALKFLRHVPLAVMTALVAQSMLVADEQWIPLADNLQFIAFIPTVIVALLTRSLLLTVLTGIGSMALIAWLT